jgi:hypothetical protein
LTFVERLYVWQNIKSPIEQMLHAGRQWTLVSVQFSVGQVKMTRFSMLFWTVPKHHLFSEANFTDTIATTVEQCSQDSLAKTHFVLPGVSSDKVIKQKNMGQVELSK